MPLLQRNARRRPALRPVEINTQQRVLSRPRSAKAVERAPVKAVAILVVGAIVVGRMVVSLAMPIPVAVARHVSQLVASYHRV